MFKACICLAICIPIVNSRVYVSLCFISADQYRIPSREEQEAVMDSFSSPSVGSGSSNFSSSELMDQVKTQLAQAYAQEFLEVSFLTLYAISMLLFTFTFSCWVISASVFLLNELLGLTRRLTRSCLFHLYFLI